MDKMHYRQRFISLSVSAILVSLSLCANAQSRPATTEQVEEKLPAKAVKFIKSYYSKLPLQSVKEDVVSWFENRQYEVLFKEGTRVEFDEDGEVIEIDGHQKAIPKSVIPQKITDYIRRSFPKNEVVRMKKNANQYFVSISNGLELIFDKNAKFLKIKD